MNYLERNRELFDEALEIRRHLHQNPEVGLYLPNTKAFVREKLESYGYEVRECGEGLTTIIGKPGKCIMLRADMDGLPIKEENDLDFISANDNMHGCGHDMHTASLLIAAKMLKENEANIKGTIKFSFQPAEEVFLGSKNMVEAGILENPHVDCALAFHVAAGKLPEDIVLYNSKTVMMYSSDNFRITVKGKASHGAYPHHGIDPINVAVNIYNAMLELIAREVDPTTNNVLTIGTFHAGTSLNVIPEIATLEGTLRCNNRESRDKLVERLAAITEKMAEVYGASGEFEILANVPMLINNQEQTEAFVEYIKDLDKEANFYENLEAIASEDFAVIAELIPTTYMMVSAGFLDTRGDYPVHNPKVLFNESYLKKVPAYFAIAATKWLEANK